MGSHVRRPLKNSNRDYKAWVRRVSEYASTFLGVDISQYGELPFEDGYSVGDSPAEFCAGVIDPLRTESL